MSRDFPASTCVRMSTLNERKQVSIGVGCIFLVLMGLGTVLWIVALVDALRRPSADWHEASQNQLIWVGVIILANSIGAVLYWLIARPHLNRV